MPSTPYYRGRFAPSPTGPLHFGSLVAAVGSYLDAKRHHGAWLVRIEDLDAPRCVAGAADGILRTLEAYGLHWDETVLYQSERSDAYEEALAALQQSGMVYPCCCTRKEIADSALHGIEGFVYPGTCRNGLRTPSPLTPDGTTSQSTKPASGQVAGYLPHAGEGKFSARTLAWRVRTDHIPSPLRGEGARERGLAESTLPPSGASAVGSDGTIQFDDALQGHITQHLEREIGDFVVKRADGLFAYQLAVVVDDAFQRITHIVRGADLLASTPRQIWLQHLLGLPTPHYLHLPVAVNAQGEKLSKQTLAPAVTTGHIVATLIQVLEFLRQQPPAELREGSIEEVLQWAVENWQPERLKGCLQIQA